MSRFKRLRALVTTDSEAPSKFRARAPNSAAIPVAVIDLASAYRAYGEGARFVDVREPDEWAHGHIQGAAHHPVGTIEAEPRLDADANTPIVTYCRTGPRAARAAAALAANGYRHVHALSGGYEHWRQAGYPVAGEDIRRR